MKEKYKVRKEAIKDFVVDNVLFVIMVGITIVFVTSPVWLRSEALSNAISEILSPLKCEGYKSSYVETLGAILGTFLAITGAIWTQKREGRKREKQLIKEAATIIYYDFKFAFQDIFLLMQGYEDRELVNLGGNYFDNTTVHVEIYLDDDWVRNVVKLQPVLTNDELKQIYELYGAFKMCVRHFENNNELIREEGFEALHEYILDNLCAVREGETVEIVHLEKNDKVMRKLEEIIGGE